MSGLTVQAIESLLHHGGPTGYLESIPYLGTAVAIRICGTTAGDSKCWTTTGHDILGRVTDVTGPDGGLTRFAHRRFSTTATNTLGQTSTTTGNALGETVGTRDHDGGTVTFGHDPAGQRTQRHALQTRLGHRLEERLPADPHVRRARPAGRPRRSPCRAPGAVEHYEKTTYDQYERVFQVFDASRTEARFTDNGVRHVYNANGYPEKLPGRRRQPSTARGRSKPQVVYRTVTATDARGNVTAETLGNGVKRAHRHDGKTGRVLGILSTRAATGDRQNLTYAWDALGILEPRKRGSGPSALTETFGYDTLNRPETYRAGTRAAQTLTYDGYGNVRTKSGVGAYAYGVDRNAPMGTTAGPHAVATVKKSDNTEVTYAYDDNGNNTSSSDGRTVAWATSDKPTSIAKGGHTTAFAYAPDRSRFRRIDSNGQGDTTTLYLGGVEKITHPDDSTEIKRYIGGVVIETEGPAIGTCPADATRYVLRDHLGSVDVLTDSLGNAVKSVSFDAWGRARNPADWSALTDMEAMTIDRCDTRRGFTGHEMLDAVGVIHMNGRIYDPTLARFLQADPFVQFPTNLQSHNRYSYVMNNPLAYTDPSGHFIGGLFAIAAQTVAAHLFHKHVLSQVPLLNAVGQVFACTAGGIPGCIGFSVHSACAQTGSFQTALKAGAFAGITAAAFNAVGAGPFGYGVGDGPAQLTLNALASGVVGGVLHELQGGKFGHRFLSAGVSAFAKPAIRHAFGTAVAGKPYRIAARAVVGGTLSSATGGKFANGAVTAAFSHA